MSALDLSPVDQPTAHDFDIIHLTCCREDSPSHALCGTDVSTMAVADQPGQECVVCGDIADGVSADGCPHGGRCPE